MRAAAALLVLLASAPVLAADPVPLPRGLEEPLQDLARALSAEKTPEGWGKRRLAYSRRFKALAGGRWETIAYRDTAEGDRLKCERVAIALAGGPSGPWRIDGERVEDVYDGLYRPVPGGEAYSRFDSFAFEAEGMRLSAAGGGLATTSFAGKVASITVVGDAMTFEYAPPPDVPEAARIARVLAEEKPERHSFVPERFTFSCGPRDCASILDTAFRGLRAAQATEVPQGLIDSMRERSERLDASTKENGFRGFRLPPREENRYWNVSVKRKGTDDYAAWLSFDDEDGREVAYGTSEDGRLHAYHAERTRKGTVDPLALERRDDSDGLDYEVRSIEGSVDLAREDAETLSGDLVYVLRTKRALREVPFFVSRLRPEAGASKESREPSLSIDAIQDGQGRDLMFVRLGAGVGLVVLREEVPSGTDLRLRVAFENRGAIYKLSPSYSRVDRGGWLPFVRFTDRIEHWDVTVRVPSQYTTLAVGRMSEERREGGASVTRWTADAGVSFPTVIFGKYVKANPGISAKRQDGTEIPVTIWVDDDGMQQWQIRPKQLPALADQAVNALNLYREIFGVDYPYPKLDLVNDPLGFLYGQSPASIVYVGSGAFRGSGTMGSALGSGATTFMRSLVAHEVGHQWWGGAVTNANERSYWWVESLAEYAAALFEEAVAGAESRERGVRAYLEHVEGWRKETLEAGLFGSVQDGNVVNVGGRRAALYAKGPYVFHMLRSTVGDEVFFKFLKALGQELQGREIVTRDIQRVAERQLGGSLETFFDQWIRGAGIPELSVVWKTRQAEDQTWIVEGTVRQRVVLGEKRVLLAGVNYEGLVAVVAKGMKSKHPYAKRMLLKGAETPFQFKMGEEPADLEINPNGEMLAYSGTVTRAP